MTSWVSRGKAHMSDLCELEDICYHQEHHPGGVGVAAAEGGA